MISFLGAGVGTGKQGGNNSSPKMQLIDMGFGDISLTDLKTIH